MKKAEKKQTKIEMENFLELIGWYESSALRKQVAENPNTSAEILEILALDKDWEVRWRVACNPSTPAGILKILAKDVDLDVCSKAIENIKNLKNN